VLGFCFSPNPIIEGNGKDRVEKWGEKGEIIVLFF